MKRIIGVLIWTLLFISLGIYSENKIYVLLINLNLKLNLFKKY